MNNSSSSITKATAYLLNRANEFNASYLIRPFINENFRNCSGSSKPYQHHYGTGGLVIHTQEVVELCLSLANKYEINEELAFLSAFFHDIGKMWDYECVNGVWGSTPHKREIHHISRSAIEWNKIASANNYDTNLTDQVTHAILAHHGQREWGSPVAPKTKLAWLLHLCDGISARMDDADRWDHIQ